MKYTIESKCYEIKLADVSSPALVTPKKVFDILKEDFNCLNESLYLLALNVKNQLIDKILIAKGGYNTLSVSPVDILRPLLLTSGNHYIVAHNHPSGDPTPSEEDIAFTAKLKKASALLGLTFLDHVIFTSTSFTSLRKEDLL